VVQLTTKLVHIGLEKEIVRDENHITLTSQKRKDKRWKGNLSRTSTRKVRMKALLSRQSMATIGSYLFLPIFSFISLVNLDKTEFL